MTDLLVKTLSGSGQIVVSDSVLGKGGEGSVFTVLSHDVAGLAPSDRLVAKIYHNPDEGDRRDKIRTMIIHAPQTSSVAWPLGILYDGENFVGYVMTKLNSDTHRQWAELSNTKDRRRTSPDFDVKYALVACRNLAAAIESLHKIGHKVGDVNESNIFVKADASVLVVDADSAQISSKDGKVFPCLVGKPEYTAPEISKGSLKNHPRTVATDTFALAVAVFQMITGGAHPTDGIYIGDGDPPSVIEKIRQGTYPGLGANSAQFNSAPRIPSDCIPSRVSEILRKSLNVHPGARPPLYEFIHAIDDVLGSLQHCKSVKNHWYDTRDGSCPWCALGQRPDPWGPAKEPTVTPSNQTVLPAVAFSDGNVSAPTVRRVAPVIATTGVPPANANAPIYHTQAPAGFTSGHNTGNSQGPLGSSYTHQTVPAQHIPEPPVPKIPNKIKGKTVLSYSDGTYAIRPPLGQLIRSNPRVAIFAIKNETPNFAHAWWNNNRPVTKFWALFTGLIVGLGFAATWRWTLPLLEPLLKQQFPKFEALPELLALIGQAAILTSVVAVLSLFFSALRDMGRARKQNKDLNVFKRDKVWVTILRFIPIPVVYGPFLIVFLAVLFVLSVLSVVLSVLTSGVRQNR